MKNIGKSKLAKLLALGILVGGTTGAAALQQADAEAVTQDQTAQENFQSHRGHHGREFMQNVDRTVEKLDNGVAIILTTDDPDTLQKLQEFASKTPDEHHRLDFMQNVTRTVELLDNGVKITLTSDDPDTIAKLQEGPLGGGQHPDLMQNSQEKLPFGPPPGPWESGQSDQQ